jgi:hypothetical protein
VLKLDASGMKLQSRATFCICEGRTWWHLSTIYILIGCSAVACTGQITGGRPVLASAKWRPTALDVDQAECCLRVKMRRTRIEHILSALPPLATEKRTFGIGSSVPETDIY